MTRIERFLEGLDLETEDGRGEAKEELNRLMVADKREDFEELYNKLFGEVEVFIV